MGAGASTRPARQKPAGLYWQIRPQLGPVPALRAGHPVCSSSRSPAQGPPCWPLCCCTQRKGRCLLLRCTDHGSGISADNLARIFNPFFTTKAEGTGLGLSIVHKILEQHNATVEVVSEAGSGTSFLIRFPLDQNGGDPCTGNGY